MPEIIHTAGELLMIAVILVFIIDVSGAKDTLLRFVTKFTGKEVLSLRPFTCSLCMTWWIGLVWLILSRSAGLYEFAVLAVVSALTKPLAGLFIFILEACAAVTDWLMEKIRP